MSLDVSARTAVVTIVSGRHAHLAAQHRSLALGSTLPDDYIVVAIDDPEVAAVVAQRRWPTARMIEVNRSPEGLPLAAARNAGAEAAIEAGAEVLIFLDVDCIASAHLVNRYRAVAQHDGPAAAIYSGTVRYLPPAPPGGYQPAWCERHGQPHPARPVPGPDEIIRCENPDLFWSLSFALPVPAWQMVGGFWEDYVGYGGEDTDFAAAADRAGLAMWWVGGADSYHQHHPASDPPVEHLDDIIRNAAIFHERWNRWPMNGWLEQFRDAGLAHVDETGCWVAGSATS
jgi:GT2 family glycosyltransferase